MLETTENLINTFRHLCIQSPFYAGLAVLYVYESQIPEVAGVKIDGLQQFYGMNNAQDYEFFTVHQTADIYHAESEMQLIETHASTEEQANEVLNAAQIAADALWQFLDGIYQKYCQDIQLEQDTSIEPILV
jgi:pyrroloquinoline-quinone synthase